VVGPGFEEQNPPIGIFTETGGKHGTARTAAHDHHIRPGDEVDGN